MNKRKYKEKEEVNMALKVEARKGEDVENLLRRFKRKLKKEEANIIGLHLSTEQELYISILS